MPHFMIVIIPYVNLLNLSWIIKCLFLRNMEPFIFITVWANSADDKLIIFLLEIGVEILCKPSLQKQFASNGQPFSNIIEKYFKMHHLLKFLPSILSINN